MWGAPLTWQGWVVTIVFIAATLASAIWIRPDLHPVGFIAWTTGMSIVFVGICWLKGEPPRWRWGDEVDSEPGKDVK